VFYGSFLTPKKCRRDGKAETERIKRKGNGEKKIEKNDNKNAKVKRLWHECAGVHFSRAQALSAVKIGRNHCCDRRRLSG
jgi:hypothetical protein